MANKEIDHITGTETTGHVWDDNLKELNTPLPSWWLWVFWATIIWGVAYWVVYPAWPTLTGYTKGLWGWSSRGSVTEAVAAANAKKAPLFQKILDADLNAIKSDEELLRFANRAGAAAFGDNCAPCHGSGAAGTKGYPNLNDDDWLWGGTLDAVHQTIKVGIRGEHDETREARYADALGMPAHGEAAGGSLTADQIRDVSGYVLSLSGGSLDGANVENGKVQFAEAGCTGCHGEDGAGMQETGAPNLTDAIWLYGSDPKTVVETITNGRKSVMPAWDGRLDAATIKALAVYIHSRGGGQ